SRWGCWSKTGSYGFLFHSWTQIARTILCSGTIVAQNAARGEGNFHQKKPLSFTQNAQKRTFARCRTIKKVPSSRPMRMDGTRWKIFADGQVYSPSYRPNKSSSFSQKVSSCAGAASSSAAASSWMGSVCRANCKAETVFLFEVKEAGTPGAERVSSRLPSSSSSCILLVSV